MAAFLKRLPFYIDFKVKYYHGSVTEFRKGITLCRLLRICVKTGRCEFITKRIGKDLNFEL